MKQVMCRMPHAAHGALQYINITFTIPSPPPIHGSWTSTGRRQYIHIYHHAVVAGGDWVGGARKCIFIDSHPRASDPRRARRRLGGRTEG